MRLVQNGQGIVLHHHRAGVDAVALADANDLGVEGHLIVGLGHVVFPLLADVAGAGTTAVLWIGICAGAELLRTWRHRQKKGRLRCHKRPKSREETPKEGSDSAVGLGGRYRIPVSKTIAISGSIERR
jgi:hypothetical protein